MDKSIEGLLRYASSDLSTLWRNEKEFYRTYLGSPTQVEFFFQNVKPHVEKYPQSNGIKLLQVGRKILCYCGSTPQIREVVQENTGIKHSEFD